MAKVETMFTPRCTCSRENKIWAELFFSGSKIFDWCLNVLNFQIMVPYFPNLVPYCS